MWHRQYRITHHYASDNKSNTTKIYAGPNSNTIEIYAGTIVGESS